MAPNVEIGGQDERPASWEGPGMLEALQGSPSYFVEPVFE